MTAKRILGVGLLSTAGLWAVIPSTGCSSSNSSTSSGDDGGASDATSVEAGGGDGGRGCGDGVVDAVGEQCDQGAANGTGMGCEKNCTWTCTAGAGGSLTNCNTNPCFTPPTCTAKHTCVNGTAIPAGGSCGTGMVCNAGGTCVSAKCGDGLVESGEECDNGAMNGPGTGCETDCHFTCGGNDPTAHNCNSADPCTANGTCASATHTCTPGAPASDGMTCMTTMVPKGVCKGGKCTPATCGDGVLESGEQCDFGAGNGTGTGCETSCQFSCPTVMMTTGCTQPTDSCAGPDTCTTVMVSGHAGQKCVQGSPLSDGTACGTGGTCKAGLCVTANCGNGTLDTGEQCDFGTAQNGTGAGCAADCQFDCEKTPSDTCTTGIDPCVAAPKACTTVTTTFGSKTGQTCQTTTPIAACGACNGTEVCGKIPGNVCEPPKCGDGCIETGEQCDPPGATCSASCQNIVCGNGILEGTEQCDDTNTQNLDGCSSTCTLEQIQRATAIGMVFSTTSPCPTGKNALGAAIGIGAQGSVTTPLNTSVTNGGTNIMFEFEGLTDLTGENQASGLALGSLAGKQPTYTGAFNGNSDLDWWYVMEPTSVVMDGMGHWQPGSSLAATLTTGGLHASGSLDLQLVLGGTTPSKLHMSGSLLTASTGSVKPITASTNLMSPGHLPSEHDLASLASFANLTGGSLCGNVSAQSLANIPLTAGIVGMCTSYTVSDSFLDLVAGGCLGFLGVTATNPDQVDPAAPVWGAGGPYKMVLTSNHVTACKDKSGKQTATAADLATCLNAAAYSSNFTFSSDRIIVHNQ